WQWSPPIGLSDEFGDTTQASPSETTTYTVRHEGDDCLPTIARQIAYEPTEVITTISEDRTIVLGTTTTLEATGGDEYVWYPPDGLSDPFYGVTNARPTETTEYSVLISSHGLFCEDDTRSVTVFVEDEDLSVLANNKFENITIYPNP